MQSKIIEPLLSELDKLANMIETGFNEHRFVGMTAIEEINHALENTVILSRNTLERLRPNIVDSAPSTLALPNIKISGSVKILDYDWLYIKLNTLLPHCRFQTPKYLSDTIKRLLDQFIADGGTIPYHKNALLVIDEHCNMKNRSVYDSDNKSWKAVSNALKGRVFPDDDQFSLGIVLVSTPSESLSCNVFVIDAADAGEFFNMRSGGALYW
jgi:hypothetical protein